MSLTPYLHVDAELAGAAAGTEVALPADARRHLVGVLRLSAGAACHVADGAGSHAPGALADDGVRLSADARTEPAPRPRLVVAQALAKGRKFDEVVRTATEIGADGFVPVTAQRSVSRLDGKADKVLARWRAVARAAAEQSRRPWRPDVMALTPVGALEPGPDRAVLVAHPGGEPLHRRAAAVADTAEIAVAIGPEGGWSDDEVEQLVARGAHVVGLGPSVLRTEHAAAAALAVLCAVCGRWDGTA